MEVVLRLGLVLGLGLVSVDHPITKTKLTLILILTLTLLALLPSGQSRVCSDLGPPLRGLPNWHPNLGLPFGGLPTFGYHRQILMSSWQFRSRDCLWKSKTILDPKQISEVQRTADSAKMTDVPIFRWKNYDVRFRCLVVYQNWSMTFFSKVCLRVVFHLQTI